MTFTTKIESKGVTVYGLKDNECVESASFTVEWEASLEYREWGIKDFSASVRNITGEYVVLNYDTDKEETRTFDFAEFKENVKFDVEWSEYRQFSPSEITIDLSDKSVEVG